MELNAATVNTPRKSFLLPPVAQAAALAKLYRRNRVVVSVQPEMYGALAQALRGRRRWGVFQGEPNTKLPHFEVGTGIVYDKIRYKVIDSYNLHFPWDERPKTGLNVPVILLKNRVTGYTFAVVAVHIPTKSAVSNKFRQHMKDTVREYAASLDCPVIIAGDFNDAFVIADYKDTDFKNTIKEERGNVDHVVVKKFKVISSKKIVEGVHNRITDHREMLVVVLETKTQNKTERPRVLPKS